MTQLLAQKYIYNLRYCHRKWIIFFFFSLIKLTPYFLFIFIEMS